MEMRFVRPQGLKDRGYPGSRQTVWRKERAGKFPKRTYFGERAFAWDAAILDAYFEALSAGHTEEEATAIAEQLRARIRDKSAEAES